MVTIKTNTEKTTRASAIMPRLRRHYSLHFPSPTTTAKPNTNLLFQISHRHRTFCTFEKQALTQQHLLSLLLKSPISHKAIQQVHSLLLTTGLLNHFLQLFNTLVRSYSLSDFPHQAFLLFKQFQQVYSHSPPSSSPISFDSFTYNFLIGSATNYCCPIIGTQLHSLTIKVGFQYHVYVQTSLVNMYTDSGILSDALLLFDEMREKNTVTWNVLITGLVKLGQLELARSLFEQMPNKNVVSWTGIIDGYVRMDRCSEGLALFRTMASSEGVKPNEITVLAVLPAIWRKGDLKACGLIHGYGEKRGFVVSDIRVANSFIDAYAKCGSLVSALKFSEEICMERKNLVTWTSIISGFALHGMGKEAVESFGRMEKAGWKPNRVTLLSVLNACSHGGLVEEGLKFFERMVGEYQVLPDIKHYCCLVDMLGRSGRLEEAEKIALRISHRVDGVVIWRTLLSACSFHDDVKMGERVTSRIMELEKGCGADYVLMHNIFTGAGRFQDAERLRRILDKRNVYKVPGHSLA